MPNVHLTPQMTEYVEREIASGAYANTSEVVRAGLRLLMEQQGARDFYRLKASFEEADRQVASGEAESFDLHAFLSEKRTG